MAVINGGQTLTWRPCHGHGAVYFAGLIRANAGGAKGTRTPNPLLAKQVRYQLRHGPGWPRSHPPKAARPTHDGTSSRLAGTTAENFTPDEVSLAISRSMARTAPRLG